MPNELDWTGTPQSAPLGQDGAVMQDDVKELCERLLSDLLAVIHRDGGHRQDEVGLEQAWMEAMLLVPFMLDNAATIARLSAKNEALASALKPFAQDLLSTESPRAMRLIAISRAESLRRAADALEARDNKIRQARAALKALEGTQHD